MGLGALLDKQEDRRGGEKQEKEKKG